MVREPLIHVENQAVVSGRARVLLSSNRGEARVRARTKVEEPGMGGISINAREIGVALTKTKASTGVVGYLSLAREVRVRRQRRGRGRKQ